MPKDENNKEPKHKSTVDKVIMGAIIGTAVGSAIGASMAPKKGSETREDIKQRASVVSDDLKEVGTLAHETTSGIFRLLKRLLFGRSKKKTKHDMKQIPNEMEIIPPEYADRD